MLAIPVALALGWFGANSILVFGVSLVAIYPLAETMAKAAETLAETLGPTIGGLLNALLNYAPEIIIATRFARNNMDLAIDASIGSSIQIILLAVYLMLAMGFYYLPANAAPMA